jgi:fructose-1,6-bisphosphatase/inositol monophosphatase family enzyme
MNQYLDAAIKAARAAGALVRENFGRPLKVNVEEAHDIKLELDVRSQALITDYQGTRAPINILKAEFDNLRASQLQILHKPKNGEVRKGTAVRFDLSKGGGTIPLP